MANSNWIYVTFTESGVPKEGLTVTGELYNLSAATHETIAFDEVGDGIYKFDLSTLVTVHYSPTGNYVVAIDGSDTLSSATERYKFWANWSNIITKVVNASAY